MNQPEPAWTAVGEAADWGEEGKKVVSIGARRIGVYRHQGRWYALKDACPHAGVGLCQGPVDGGEVACIGHGWTFSLEDGGIRCGPAGFRTPSYPVRVTAQGKVEVGI